MHPRSSLLRSLSVDAGEKAAPPKVARSTAHLAALLLLPGYGGSRQADAQIAQQSERPRLVSSNVATMFRVDDVRTLACDESVYGFVDSGCVALVTLRATLPRTAAGATRSPRLTVAETSLREDLLLPHVHGDGMRMMAELG